MNGPDLNQLWWSLSLLVSLKMKISLSNPYQLLSQYLTALLKFISSSSLCSYLIPIEMEIKSCSLHPSSEGSPVGCHVPCPHLASVLYAYRLTRQLHKAFPCDSLVGSWPVPAGVGQHLLYQPTEWPLCQLPLLNWCCPVSYTHDARVFNSPFVVNSVLSSYCIFFLPRHPL